MPQIRLRQDTVTTLVYVADGHSKGQKQCIYWDKSLECFGVRVYPTGRRCYVCSYRVNRRKRLAKLGRVDALTLDQARKKAAAYLGAVANNKDPQEEKDELKSSLTVAQLVKAYIEGHAKPQKSTWLEDQSTLNRNLIPDYGTTLARNLSSAHISQISVRIGTTHPAAANNFLDVVRKMFNWARTPAKLVPRDMDNPVTGVQRFRKRRRRRFLTTAEMPVFVRALEQDGSEYARHAMWVLLLTGMRMNEVLKAKWENVDWDAGTLFVGLTKNGEPLLAPLSDMALARLRMIPRVPGNPHIFPGRVPGSHQRSLQALMERIKKRSGIQNLRVHDIRRTVGSWLAQAGISLHLIGDVLNHLDTSTTAGYAYFQTQHRRDALAGHGDKVLQLGAPHLIGKSTTEALSASTLLLPSPTELPVQETQKTRRRHYFKRDELYKLVWTAPVMELARRIGVSDVALAKLCRRAEIPLPYRGYWARVESGQPLRPTPLPPPPDGLPELLWIRGKPAANDTDIKVQEAA